MYFLRSERLGLRPWTAEDLPLALALWGDPKVTALIDARGRLKQDQVEERLEQEMATLAAHGFQYWPLFLLDGDRHVGCCGLRPYRPDDEIYELGVHVRSAYWGRGYATEACRVVMGYAFDELGAAALFAGHNPKNEGSRRLIQKLGFAYTHDEYYSPTGLHHPSYLLTAEAYTERLAPPFSHSEQDPERRGMAGRP